ncbi:MAG: hypothetical protein ABSE08_19105 [Syntrophobacteraceae bacterium]|jgi:hypothetical protein
MKKLLIGSAIVFLMIFTAGFATAGVTTTITGTGNLLFIAPGGTQTLVTGAMISITNQTPIPGGPTNVWSGTLTLPPGNPLNVATLNITAFRGPQDPHLFHRITSSDGSTLLLTAEGRDNERAWYPPKKKLGFGIRGTVYDPGTFIGSFEGVLFY